MMIAVKSISTLTLTLSLIPMIYSGVVNIIPGPGSQTTSETVPTTGLVQGSGGYDCVSTSNELIDIFLEVSPKDRFTNQLENSCRFGHCQLIVLVYDEVDNVKISRTKVQSPTIGRDSCPAIENSTRYIYYYWRNTIFYNIPAPLVFSLGMLLYNRVYGTEPELSSYARDTEIYVCWTLPTLCGNDTHGHSPYYTLRHFSREVIQKYPPGPVLHDFGNDDIHLGFIESKNSGSSNRHTLRVEYLTPFTGITASLVAFLLLYWWSKSYVDFNMVARVSQNKFLKAILVSFMMNAWLFNIYCFLTIYRIFHYYAVYLAKNQPLLYENFLPYAHNGHYMLISVGGIFLLQVPFVILYVKKSPLKDVFSGYGINHNKQTCCKQWLSFLSTVLGFLGIIYVVQMAAILFFYTSILILVAPIQTVGYILTMVSVAILFVLITASVLFSCINCSIKSCFMELCLIATVALVGFHGLLFLICLELNSDKLSAKKPLNVNLIATSLITSFLITLLAYVIRTCFQMHKGKEETAMHVPVDYEAL